MTHRTKTSDVGRMLINVLMEDLFSVLIVDRLSMGMVGGPRTETHAVYYMSLNDSSVPVAR